jgi:hypothetical protein
VSTDASDPNDPRWPRLPVTETHTDDEGNVYATVEVPPDLARRLMVHNWIGPDTIAMRHNFTGRVEHVPRFPRHSS